MLRDSELEILNKSSHNYKMVLPCNVKQFQKVIWGRAEKKETGTPASSWPCEEGCRKVSLLCLLLEDGARGFPDPGGWDRRLGRAWFPWPWALSMMLHRSEETVLPPSYYVLL